MNANVMQRLPCLMCIGRDFVPDKSGLANQIFSTLQRMMPPRHIIPTFCRVFEVLADRRVQYLR